MESLSAVDQFFQQQRFTLADFAGLHHHSFIGAAFAGILKREPDPIEHERFLGALQTGEMSKPEILGRLRYCAAGRRQRVEVAGLFLPFILSAAGNLPVIGYGINLLVAIAKLPVLIRQFRVLENNSSWRIEQLEPTVANQGAGIEQLEPTVVAHSARIEQLEPTVANQGARIEQLEPTVANHSTAIEQLAAQGTSVVEQLAATAAAHGASIEQLSTAMAAHEQYVKNETDFPEAVYMALENEFRGSTEDLEKNMAGYLPQIQEAAALGAPVLDLGCGRGEWLGLLQKNGIPAMGVDANRTMIDLCLEKGYEVHYNDALAFLGILEDNSLPAVTAFQLMEHLPPVTLIRLWQEVYRVLIPGGLVLFETPNPENFQVSAYYFFLDPTHRKPIPPPLATYTLNALGFQHIKVIRARDYDPPIFEDPRLNRFFCAPMDYAVIGKKPTEKEMTGK